MIIEKKFNLLKAYFKLQEDLSKNKINFRFVHSLNIPTLHDSQIERINGKSSFIEFTWCITKLIIMTLLIILKILLKKVKTSEPVKIEPGCSIAWLFPGNVDERIVAKIKKNGYTDIVTFQLDHVKKTLTSKFGGKTVGIYGYYSQLEIKDLLVFFYAIMKIHRFLRDSDLGENKKLKILSDLYSTKSLTLFSLEKLFKTLACKFDTTAVGTTIEGNSIEDMFFKVQESVNVTKLKIGYQHTLVYDPPVGFERMASNFSLNILWCTGPSYADSLCRLGLADQYLCVGDYRIREGNQTAKGQDFYFIIDGEVSVALRMLQILSAEAKSNQHLRFKYRIHPALRCNRKLRSMINKLSLLDNISCDNEVNYDFGDEGFAVYTNSIVIIDAIRAKLIPVYLDIQRFDIDPLKAFDLKCVKLRQTPFDFDKIAKETTRDIDFEKQINEINRYFRPVE